MADRPLTNEEEKTVRTGAQRAAEWWVIASRGRLAFRWGPFVPQEIGPIVDEAEKRHLAVSVVGNVGTEIDWQFIDDLGCWLEGHPPRPVEDAGAEYDTTQRPINPDHASIDPKTGEVSISVSGEAVMVKP